MPEARLTVWGEAECRRLHEATLELLADTGVDVRYEPALALFSAAGASVDGRRVRIPARLVDDALASAPREWLLKPRGGDTAPLALRDGEVYYGTGSDVLYVRDPESGERRRVRRADVEGMAALCEVLPNIDFVMSMGLPEDAPQGIDDLVQVVAMLRGTRKPLLVAPRDGSVLARMQEMAAACGEKESFGIYAMPSPPLMHDPDALTKVIGCAELLIPLIYAPAPNMGATGPRSIAGAVLVGNAETLSGLVLHQHVKRGAPFVYGVGAGAMDMRTMTDPYLSPDALLAQQVGTDMARHYGLPSFSYAGMADSKVLDEDEREAALSMAYGSLSRATILHDVGYLESGCRAATSPSSSGTSSWATRASSCARCRWTTTAWRWTRSRPPAPGATTSRRSTRAGTTASSGCPRSLTTTSTTAGPPRARRRSAPACARSSPASSPRAAPSL